MDISLFVDSCFISPGWGCCCFFLPPPAWDGHPWLNGSVARSSTAQAALQRPGLAMGFALALQCFFMGRLRSAVVSCMALIAIQYFLPVSIYLQFQVSFMFFCCFINSQQETLFFSPGRFHVHVHCGHSLL